MNLVSAGGCICNCMKLLSEDKCCLNIWRTILCCYLENCMELLSEDKCCLNIWRTI